MNTEMKDSQSNTNFKKIRDLNDLITYLNTIHYDRIDFVYHYTSVNAIENIIKDRCWYLGSSMNMNDGLELKNVLESQNDIFFSSFMIQQKESVAMWSMYAQPWSDGIMVAIPSKEFKSWVKNINEIYRVDDTYKLETKIQDREYEVKASRVAYLASKTSVEKEMLRCGGSKNSFFNENEVSGLYGYIKDDAWSYENELRLRVDAKGKSNCPGVGVKVPEYILNSMRIICGPRFEGDLKERLSCDGIHNNEIIISNSIYKNKLNKIPCDKCELMINDNENMQ